MRILIIITVFAIFNTYIVSRIINGLALANQHFLNIAIIVPCLTYLQVVGFIGLPGSVIEAAGKLGFNGLITGLYKTSYLILGILSCASFYIIIVDIVRIILRILLSSSSSIYACFDRVSIPIVIVITSVTVILGMIEVARGPAVKKVEVYLKNLPKSFDGFAIIQISDLHVGSTIKYDYVEKVVSIANSLKPNLIALTGDFVDGSVEQLKNDIMPLNRLVATHGKFFVTGNHEYYSGAEEWLQKFENLGIKNLLNEHVLIENNNEQIILAGVTDYSTIRGVSRNVSSPEKSIKGAPTGLIKILLAHQPASYVEAHRVGFHLQLSGHTHGGQYFPFTTLIRFFHRYYEGLNLHDGMWIYVSKGTGYWGPPLRLGASPEVTVITLKSL